MSDKELIKNIYKETYLLQEKYLYTPLDDALWEKFIGEMTALREKYKPNGENIDRLVRTILGALSDYKERKDGKETHNV